MLIMPPGRRAFMTELDPNTGNSLASCLFGDFGTLAKYAIMARRAMHDEGTGPHVWKEIAVNQRRWAHLTLLRYVQQAADRGGLF